MEMVSKDTGLKSWLKPILLVYDSFGICDLYCLAQGM